MSGLQVAIGQEILAGFLLAVARTAGFVLVTPPFNTRAIPAYARGALAVALALPLSLATIPTAPPLTSTALLLDLLLQLVLGLVTGFFVLVAVATITAIGDLMDLVGGFQMALALDPLQLVQTSVMGRLHQLLAVTLLFVSNGHLLVLDGLARSVQAMPLPAPHWNDIGLAVTGQLGGLTLAALEVAAPVLAAMFVADVSLGLLTRAAPALNAFTLGFPLKILFTLLLAGFIVARVPHTLTTLVGRAVQLGLNLSGAGG